MQVSRVVAGNAAGQQAPCLDVGEVVEAFVVRRISHVGTIPSVTRRDRDSRHAAIGDAATRRLR
jgi:hypothetical protein